MTGDGALFDVPSSAATSTVRDAYERAVEQLRAKGVLAEAHEGLAANLLRLATIIDTERKGYAVAQATAQAHDIMKTLLALDVDEKGDDPFEKFLHDLADAHPKPGSPSS